MHMPTQHGPWTILKSTVKYANPWMTVREDEVLRPDGKPGIYGTVTIKPGSSVLAMDEDGMVYLLDEFGYAANHQGLVVANGGFDAHEAPLACAKRELKEELGIEGDEWIELGFIDPHPSAVDSPAYLFMVRKLHFGAPHHEGTETLRMVKMSFADAVAKVMDGTITHAPSCVVILKAKEYLKL